MLVKAKRPKVVAKPTLGLFFCLKFSLRGDQMNESILSVGIDIGTLTTQLVFSRITIDNTASIASVPMIKIIDKEVVYRSKIHFTPLLSPIEIDGASVRKIIEAEYKKAGIKPKDVVTGAEIITRETARKKMQTRF